MNCETKSNYRFNTRRCAIACLLSVALLVVKANVLTAQVAAGPNAPREVTAVIIPPPGYFAAFKLYQAGQYHAAAVGFTTLIQPVVLSRSRAARTKQVPVRLPIDAICYFTMRGECSYHLGEYAAAMQDFETAVGIHLDNRMWLDAITRQNDIRAMLTPAPIPWGERGAAPGDYPATVTLAHGRGLNQPYTTGVLSSKFSNYPDATGRQPQVKTICVQEIVRCTCLSLYRWHQLVGPLREHHPFSKRLIATIHGAEANVIVRVNGVPLPADLLHPWARVWKAVEGGMVAALEGKPEAASAALTKGTTLYNLDHPLTGYALLMLGHLSSGQADIAQNYYLQASLAAARYNDLTVVEEALRAGAELHLSSDSHVKYAPLEAAILWATNAGSSQLLATLLLLAAESDYQIGELPSATARLATATGLIAGTEMALGRIGARLNYLKAMVAYGQQDAADAEPALQATLAFQCKGSYWQFRAGLIDLAWQKRIINERQAAALYASVLSDPTPVDWMVDPLEALSSQIIPHAGLYENWFDAALARRDRKLALEIVERLRRHRFLSTLDMGGRLLSLRWVLEAPDEAIGQDGQLQRQRLLARLPKYAEESRRARQLQAELRKLPLLPDTPDDVKHQHQTVAELKRAAAAQEAMLRQVALDRQPCMVAFPPLKTADQLQTELRDGQAMWVFFEGSKNAHAFALTSAELSYWQLDVTRARLASQVKSLLEHFGNHTANKQLVHRDLAAGGWQTFAEELGNHLIKGSPADFLVNVKELVIVPDGELWYLPYESLLLPGNSQTPLIARLRLRYSPTAGLALGDMLPHRAGRTVVMPGRAMSSEQKQTESDRFSEFQQAVPDAEALRGKLPADLAMLATTIDQLVVDHEVQPQGDAYHWTPMPSDGKLTSGTLSDWLALPWGGPDQAFFLGFHTAAERPRKSMDQIPPANELFLSLCGLMATGTRTVVISRWRTGGQTNYDLVREFARTLPTSTASEAWQNAVQVVTSAPLAAEKEPRLKHEQGAETPSAAHPFFWSGLLLTDTGSPPTDNN